MNASKEKRWKSLLNYMGRAPRDSMRSSAECEGEAGLQERVILTLEGDPRYHVVKEVLKTSLSLTHKLLCLAFHDFSTLLRLRDAIDSIKKLAVGLGSAECKSKDYRIADYSMHLFAYQQYFHSAYRANQGTVLERLLALFVKENFRRLNVPAHKIRYERLFNEITGSQPRRGGISHDLDLVLKRDGGFIVIQIRSRDDTGGATAKRSLSAPLRPILEHERRTGRGLRRGLDYIIYVWEPLDQSQKGSLVNNTISELGIGPEGVEDLKRELMRGSRVELGRGLTLQIVYGTDKLIDTLCSYEDCREIESLKATLEEMLDKLGKWDDLWLTYAIVSLELDNYILKGYTNIAILEDKLRNLGITLEQRDLENYRCSSIDLARKLMPYWKEDTLPVKSPSDQLHYLRDLVLLRMMYQKIRRNCSRILKDIKPLKLISS